MNAEIKKRMIEVNDLVKTLEPEVRATAFSMMQSYITGSKNPIAGVSVDTVNEGQPASDNSSIEEFFGNVTVKEPYEAVKAVVAYLYSQYGIEPFTVADIKELGNRVGFTLPERVDMTLRSAKKSGKALFRSTGRGVFAPTVHGEKALREEYSVNKGRNKRPKLDK